MKLPGNRAKLHGKKYVFYSASRTPPTRRALPLRSPLRHITSCLFPFNMSGQSVFRSVLLSNGKGMGNTVDNDGEKDDA